MDLSCAENSLYDADCLHKITETRVCRCHLENLLERLRQTKTGMKVIA